MGNIAKRERATASGITLSLDDVRVVKGMLDRGDAQHFIAAWFGVNPGRIAEIATGQAHPNIAAPVETELPPPGPYLTPRETVHIARALTQASNALAQAERLLGLKLSN